MEVIKIRHPHCPEIHEPIVLVLGFFDGVHRGHQAVIQTARDIAQERGLKLALMTFNQHPKIVYSRMKPEEMDYLSDYERKMALFEEQGVDLVFLVDFTYPFGAQSPEAFVERYIVGLNAQVAVAGFDYTYGLKEVANMTTLPTHAAGRFEVIEVPKQVIYQDKIGSTSIRELIQTSQIDEANEALGYVYETNGVVVHGEKRGRTIGFPTANIRTRSGQLQPGVGIYTVELKVGNDWYQGMASIGYNVTFDTETGLTVEVNIFDFSEMIYGEEVTVRWHHYLRGEVKFDGIDGLIAQLQQDKANSLAYFEQLEATANLIEG